jgi:TatD DNase family protein
MTEAFMHFFDSHCHFDFVAFNTDRAALWHACKSLGVARLLMPGVTPKQWQTAAQLAAGDEGLYYAAGIHPHWIEQQPWFQTDKNNVLGTSLREKITTLIQQEFTLSSNVYAGRCVAVGECGLDKLITTPFELQQQLLSIHIDVARQLHKPLIIHCVRAHNEMIALLKKNKPEAGGVIHGFSGSYEVAQQYVDLGFYLGIGGGITYERAQKTRTAAAKIPLEYLVLETDAPDMPLQGKQGQRNSPEYLPQIAQVLADLRGNNLDEIAAATCANAERLFRCS